MSQYKFIQEDTFLLMGKKYPQFLFFTCFFPPKLHLMRKPEFADLIIGVYPNQNKVDFGFNNV